MRAKLVIFGSGEMGELAQYYFEREGKYEIAAFTLDGDFITSPTQQGLPVVAFEELSHAFPSSEYHLFVALGYAKVNRLRRDKYTAAKSLGYRLASYISPEARVLSDHAFGDNCFIFEDNVVQPFVRIGSNVTMWSGNHIGHHSTIEDHCFIASHAVISGGVHIEQQCFIGVNATLRDHIRVGQECIVGAGALLTSSAEARGVYIGPKTPRSDFSSNLVSRI